jgi:hypothetical protein
MPRQEFVHSRPFNAGFDSDCEAGGDSIEEGDRIVIADGEPSHVECFDHGDCPASGMCD